MALGLRVARETYRITSVDRQEVLRYLGYHGQELSDELDERIDSVATSCLKIAKPRATISVYPVLSLHSDEVALDGCTLRLTGHDIAQHLHDATQVALFAATLGIGIDQELRRLSLTDALGQVIFDSVATALVERAADAANAHIRAYAANLGAFTSWRFSPGYGDLPLTIQSDFLRTIDATRQLGITLTPSNMMVPTKSVTAVVGIHPTPQPGLEDSCSVCSLAEFCTIRATGRTCRG